MKDQAFLDSRRRALKHAVHAFSNAGKREGELWVARTFVRNLGLNALKAEFIAPADDPPDIAFRDARFEVKELLDAGRRRHDEYKHAYARALVTRSPAELLEGFTPRDTTIEAVYRSCLKLALPLNIKYAPAVRANLDLLIYHNLRNVTGLTELPFPDVAELVELGWRSVSFLMGYRACCLHARADAPGFLRATIGVVTHRRF